MIFNYHLFLFLHVSREYSASSGLTQIIEFFTGKYFLMCPLLVLWYFSKNLYYVRICLGALELCLYRHFSIVVVAYWEDFTKLVRMAYSVW